MDLLGDLGAKDQLTAGMNEKLGHDWIGIHQFRRLCLTLQAVLLQHDPKMPC
jgi:hypothetical protein